METPFDRAKDRFFGFWNGTSRDSIDTFDPASDGVGRVNIPVLGCAGPRSMRL